LFVLLAVRRLGLLMFGVGRFFVLIAGRRLRLVVLCRGRILIRRLGLVVGSGLRFGRAEHGQGRSEQPHQGTLVRTSMTAFSLRESGLIPTLATVELRSLHGSPCRDPQLRLSTSLITSNIARQLTTRLVKIRLNFS